MHLLASLQWTSLAGKDRRHWCWYVLRERIFRSYRGRSQGWGVSTGQKHPASCSAYIHTGSDVSGKVDRTQELESNRVWKFLSFHSIFFRLSEVTVLQTSFYLATLRIRSWGILRYTQARWDIESFQLVLVLPQSMLPAGCARKSSNALRWHPHKMP